MYDETGNGHILTSAGEISADSDRNDIVDRALVANQISMSLNDASALDMDQGITVAGWFKMSSFNNEWTALINKWAAAEGSYYLGVNADSRRVRWNCFYGNIEDSQPIPFDTWIHYAASYDGETLKLYRNGEMVNSLAESGALMTSPAPFNIAIQSNLPIPNYSGSIDDVHVYQEALSDDQVLEIYNAVYEPLDKDLVYLELNMTNVQVTSDAENGLSGRIFNNGLETITSFDMEWLHDFDSGVLEIRNIELKPYENYDFDLSVPLSLEVGAEVTLMTELSNINGSDDDVSTNNTQSDQTIGYLFIPDQKVVMEEGTGTWCGFCPRGALALEQLTENYPDEFIGIAVHNNDVMTLPEYDGEIGFFGFPTCHVDRTLLNAGISPAAAEAYMAERLLVRNTPRASVDEILNYDHDTRTVTLNVTVTPALDFVGDYGLSIVMTEDGVTGTGPDYAQVNNFAGGAGGPMGGYEDLPNPVPAEDMVYDHVAREVIGGVRGEGLMFPSDMVHGGSYFIETDFRIPDGYNLYNVHFVAMLLEMDSGVIVNADSQSLDLTGVSVTDLTEEYDVRLFPNPTRDLSFIQFQTRSSENVSIQLSDVTGRVLSEQVLGKLEGKQTIALDLENAVGGINLVTLNIGGQQVVQKLFVVD